jgi:hypothetical protein
VAATLTAPRGESISQGGATSKETSRVKREGTPGRTAISQEISHMAREGHSGARGKGSGGFRAVRRPAPEVRERREREGAPIAGHGRPLERKSPGEHRRRPASNIAERLNGLAGGGNPWRRPNRKGHAAHGLPQRARPAPGGNGRRGTGAERRHGCSSREGSGGRNPRSASGMKQGRDGQGGSNALGG